MYDTIESIYGSTVQHGPHNDRLYVIHLDSAQEDTLLAELDQRALRHGYGKVFAKIPEGSWETFKSAGYIREAVIPRFFSGRTDCYFVGKFFADRLRTEEDFTDLMKIVEDKTFLDRNGVKEGPLIERCSEKDAARLADCYQTAFKSYPFPVFDAGYLKMMMAENVTYYCIREEGALQAIAATESEIGDLYAEMTDFATLPPYRGQGYASALLNHMERELRAAGIITAFTIARAASLGMNKAFKKCGYTYAGLLVNNTQISGRIESMTVWYKYLMKRGCSNEDNGN